MPQEPTVSITVVLFNSEEHLGDCLDSIQADLDSGFAELIAVDNASPDGGAGIVTERVRAARLLRSQENVGFARAANSAWPHVRGRLWFLLNPDVVLPPGGLRRLVEWMDANPEIGVCSPEIGEEESAGRALPSIGLTLLEATRLHRLLPPRARGRLLRGSYWAGGDQVDAGWVPATAALARRDAVEEAGLLGEEFFMYGEDLEWTARIGRAGWRVGVCSGVRVAHAEASSVTATWGEEEARMQMARGVRQAVAELKGRPYAAAHMWLQAFALYLESVAPGRDKSQRSYSRDMARAWARSGRARSIPR